MKVLCFGDSQTDFQRTLQKAALLAKKQDFDCLLCLGDLFTESVSSEVIEALLAGEYVPTIPTYFTEGANGIPQAIRVRAASAAGEVCSNLYLLGSSGRLQMTQGAKVGYHTATDGVQITSFASAHAPLVDILLTADGPRDASREARRAVVSSLPRYHFYCDAQYSDAQPYKSRMPNGDMRITRQIALAPVANESKSKWFYAFNLTHDDPTKEVIASAIRNPYLVEDETTTTKRKVEALDEENPTSQPVEAGEPNFKTSQQNRKKKPPEGYVCKLCSEENDHYFKDCPNRAQEKKRKRGPNGAIQKHVDPSTCFFCLSNPDVAAHLIVSIGDQGAYLVLPKGGMTQNHVLILPVDHKPTMDALGESRDTVEGELDKYVDALQKLYASQGLTGIFFEISRTTGVHFHRQMLPIPESKIDDLVDAFFAFAETEGINLEKKEPETTDTDFFRVCFPSRKLTLTGPLNGKTRFDLQFGRRVISDVMGVPERAHWKDCIRSEEQEKSDAAIFKEAFKPYDFSI